MATNKITSEDAETAPASGPGYPSHPDGYVDEWGETYVYEYDEDGNYIGWGKLPSKEALAARDGH